MKQENQDVRSSACCRGIRENPVKLCHAISRLFHSRIREQGVMEGVMTQPGARSVMPLLATHGVMTQRELVNMTHLRAPSISAILKKMEEEGLVERKNNPEDHREILVSLTDRGRELDQESLQTLQATDAVALDGLTEEETETLMRLLTKIRDNLLETEVTEKGGRI